MTSDERIKLLDFGLAKLPSSDAASTTELVNARTDSNAAGSVDFMSPEQTESLANATFKSDIYSLGCTIYWLVTGKTPFQNENKLETLLAHRESDRPQLQATLPANQTRDRLDDLLQVMMAADPAQRPSSMDEFVERLGAILDESIAQRRKKSKDE